MVFHKNAVFRTIIKKTESDSIKRFICTFILLLKTLISLFPILKLIPMIGEFCVVARQQNILFFTENYRK